MELEESSEGRLIGPGIIGPIAAHDDCWTKIPAMLIGGDDWEEMAQDRSSTIGGTENIRSGGSDR